MKDHLCTRICFTLLAVSLIFLFPIYLPLNANAASNTYTIVLNANNLTIRTGYSKTLKIVSLPEDVEKEDLRFTSSNKKVAVVNSKGKVTGKSKGTAEITVTTKNKKYTTACLVKVRQYPTSVTLNESLVTISVGEKRTIKVTVLPTNASSRNVKYSSQNEKIASVSSKGVVIGLSEGETNIVATTSLGRLTASCIVKVKKPTAKWVTTAGGIQYVADGKPVTGYQKIGKYYYYSIVPFNF